MSQEVSIAILDAFTRTRSALGGARLRLQAEERAIAHATHQGEAINLQKAWSAAAEWTFWLVAFDELTCLHLDDITRDEIAGAKSKDALTRIGDHLSGFRYLRNLHAHQIAQSLAVENVRSVHGTAARLSWRLRADLPSPDQPTRWHESQQAAYDRLIGGSLVGPVIQRVTIGTHSVAWVNALERAASRGPAERS